MRHAINEKNERIEVSESGERAKCPDCGKLVIGNYGRIIPKHWKHKAKVDCDSWYEPITNWHIEWQNYFPPEYREFTLKDKINNTLHRADIRLKNGLVIEVQYSPIRPNEIDQRENFYGRNNMIWILNGENLTKHSSVKFEFKKKGFALIVEIPDYLPDVPEYNMDEFKFKLHESEVMKKLINHPDLIDCKVYNGYIYEFSFNKNVDIVTDKLDLYRQIRLICLNLYSTKTYEKIRGFDINYYSNEKDRFDYVELKKKHWRKFIDMMKFPVFIDKLNGLDKDLLYWYQENKVINRNDFIKKYSQYI